MIEIAQFKKFLLSSPRKKSVCLYVWRRWGGGGGGGGGLAESAGFVQLHTRLRNPWLTGEEMANAYCSVLIVVYGIRVNPFRSRQCINIYLLLTFSIQNTVKSHF